MKAFMGTFEYLPGQNAAIIALFDEHGEWQCAGRVDVKHGGEAAAYEVAYDRASLAAKHKGGRLEVFMRHSERSLAACATCGQPRAEHYAPREGCPLSKTIKPGSRFRPVDGTEKEVQHANA